MFSSTILDFVQTNRSDSRIRREITGGWFEIELLVFFFFFCLGAHISISS